MGENIPGLNNVVPSYPLKPAQPSRRDRRSGKRKSGRPPPDAARDVDDRADDRAVDRDDDEHLIDEYI
jgi:hypothetical protein